MADPMGEEICKDIINLERNLLDRKSIINKIIKKIGII